MSTTKPENPGAWTYKYKGQTYSRDELAEVLGIKKGTFKAWVWRYGRVNAIAIAELPESERKAEMQRLVSNRKTELKSKVDEFEIPMLDPDYELKNRIKHWVKHYGVEGAIAKASLRI